MLTGIIVLSVIIGLLIAYNIYLSIRLNKIYKQLVDSIDAFNKIIINIQSMINDNNKKVSDMEKNPAKISSRLTLLDLRIKQIENAVRNFNNGFNPNESYMNY